MRCRASWLGAALLCAGLWLGVGAGAGCGDDDGSCQPEADAAVQPDAYVPENVSFVVMTYAGRPADYVPVAGALVRFDAPGGAVLEDTTNSDGRVFFSDVDWSLAPGGGAGGGEGAGQGLAAVSAFRLEHAMRSIVGLDAARFAALARVGDDVLLLLYPQPAPIVPSVRLSGSFAGVTDPAHLVHVSVLRGATGTTWLGAADGSYSIRVPKDEAFVVQAREVAVDSTPTGQGLVNTTYRVLQAELGPFPADSMVTLDFDADEVVTQTAELWVDLPARADSPIRQGTPNCLACGYDALGCGGWPTLADLSADRSRFELSFLWTEPSWLAEPVIRCEIRREYDTSLVHVDGYPVPGSLGQLLDVPRWTLPPDPSFAWPADELIAWELMNDEVDHTDLLIYRDGLPLWAVSAGPNATSVRLPELPTTLDREDFLGTVPLLAQLQVGTWDFEHIRWRRAAATMPILLAP